MQELRRPVKQEEHKNIRELEEELIANLRKAEFLIAINAEQEEDGKLHIPYLKNKEDKIMQPVFTDVMEFEKFGQTSEPDDSAGKRLCGKSNGI